MIITIDGYSATGKSTLAKILAKKLNYFHINTGIFYRYISYVLLNNNINKIENAQNQSKSIKDVLNKTNFDINRIKTINLKTNEIELLGSQIAKIDFIRKLINEIIFKIAKESSIVIEGRDTGTVLFPNADVKFFFIADAKIRAERLAKERNIDNIPLLIDKIKKRDFEDINREIAPLIKPNNAILIDTSHITVNETLKELEKYVYK